MPITIAVALITATATLGGVSLTGILANLSAARQERAHLADLTEQRLARLRESRREAYRQFLAALGTFELQIDALWKAVPPETPPQMAASGGPSDEPHAELVDKFRLVVLEGSADVVRAAEKVLKIAETQMSALFRALDEFAGDSRQVRRCVPEYRELRMSERPAEDEFVLAARRALGSD